MTSRDVSRGMAGELTHIGVDRIFGLPGGGNNLDFISAAREVGIAFVLGHHETSVAVMASVYGDLTDAPGVCVVTRGPGAANAVNGAANAQLDRQALMLITDAVSEAQAERIAHQRIDQRSLFAPVTKWGATVGVRGDAAATTAAAAAAAMVHPRGAVHLDFDPTGGAVPGPTSHVDAADSEELERALARIAEAERPVILLGVGARHEVAAMRAALADIAAPVLMTYRAKGVIPGSSPNDAGLLTGATTEAPLLAAADLIVLVGMDSVELIPNAWPYAAPVVSLAAWPETSPYLTPEIEVVGDLGDLVTGLGTALADTSWSPGAGNAHRDAELAVIGRAGADESALSPQLVVTSAREHAPAGSIATIDAGAHMFPATCLWTVEHPDEMHISSGLATMGFALPAAIGAALARPGRRVVCFTGDGGLGMCAGELETLARLGVDVTVVVFNDAALSLIAIKADPVDDPEALSVTYRTTDFVRVAEGYGLAAARADSVADLDRALAAAFSAPGPSLIDARVDPRGYPEIMAAIRGPRETVASDAVVSVQFASR